jgi:hypothetical protein
MKYDTHVSDGPYVPASATQHVNPEFTTLEKTNHSCAPNCDAIVDAATGKAQYHPCHIRPGITPGIIHVI